MKARGLVQTGGWQRVPATAQLKCRPCFISFVLYAGSPNAVQLRRVAPCRAAAYSRKGDEATLWARKEAKLTSRIEELLAANAALTAALAAKEKETAPNARKTGQRVSSGGELLARC
jgi:hypothetical protein